MREVCAFRVFSVVLCLAVLLLPSYRADASEPGEPAVGVVEGLASDIWSIPPGSNSTERRQFLATAIEARTDVVLVGRLALGKYWRTLDESQRGDYQTLFSDVIIGGLAGRLDALTSQLDGPLEQHFVITGSVKAGKRDVVVRSKVIGADGQPFSVDWRLRDRDEQPVIIDLVVEGVSLLITQRAEFSAVIERHRLDGLIATLRKRASSQNF